MKRILITAFDAFGQHNDNPSERLLSSVSAKNTIKLILPTIYGEAEDRLIEAMEKEKPNAILMLGYSRTAKPIKLELLARNRDSTITKDNHGKTGRSPITTGGPKVISSTLPIDDIIKEWDKKGITYALSKNAGGFLCNHVLYLGLNWLKTHGQATVPCGFMHIGGAANDIVRGKEAVLSTLNVLQQ